MRRLFASLVGLLWLGPVPQAHAQRDAYPSLAPRAVESRDREAEAAAARADAAVDGDVRADAALVARMGALVARAQSADAQFAARLDDAVRAVGAARRASTGSEAWVVAQQAISMLQSSRYDSVAALATLDTLYSERAIMADDKQAAADLSALAPVRRTTLAMVDDQNDRLDDLSAQLPPR